MIKTIEEAVKFLEKYIPTPDKKHPGELGLKRMQYLMELLGNPQLKYPTIHVGGTSGKGSTATIIASILSTKYKVGLHTSPHLVQITERIRIYGSCRSRIPNSASKLLHFVGLKASEATFGSPSLASPVSKINELSQKKFVDLLNKVIPTIKEIEKSNFGVPSYFEIVTAMAFLYFSQQKVDIAVIEVGMGGRFDATNVIKPEVAVLTNVGLDHTEILGDTVEKIAEDKVGIIKSGIEVVSGVKQPSVIEIINAKCKIQNAKLSLLIPPPSGESLYAGYPRGVLSTFSYRIKKLDSEKSVFDYKGIKSLNNLRIRLLGEHQVGNASVAIKVIEVFNNIILSLRGAQRQSNLYRLPHSLRSLAMTELDIRTGLNSAFIPGRLEIISRKPLIILDGAHNPDKVRALVGAIKKIFPKKKVTSIIAIKSDKSAREMLDQLLEISEKIIFTSFQLTADLGIISSYNPKKLLELANLIDRQHRYTSRHTKVVRKMLVIDNVKKAVEEAIISAKPNDLILVTGSLYLMGEIKRKLQISNCK